MEIRQLDDSKVDEIIKRSEREGAARRAAIKSGAYDADSSIYFSQKITMIIIVILVIISLVQSFEIIRLKQQLRSGQSTSAR